MKQKTARLRFLAMTGATWLACAALVAACGSDPSNAASTGPDLLDAGPDALDSSVGVGIDGVGSPDGSSAGDAGDGADDAESEEAMDATGDGAPEDAARPDDAALDSTGPDAGNEDAPDDVASDAPADVAPDAPADVAPDAPADVAPDAPADVAPDAPADVAPEVAPCAASPLEFGPVLELGDTWQAVDVARCGWLAMAMAIPSGSAWDIEIRQAPETLRASVQAPRWVDLFDAVPPPQLVAPMGPTDAGEVRLRAEPARGGEWWLALSLEGASVDARVELRAVCVRGCERETTRFPIVLQHGYAGVDSYFGVLDYFFRVVPTLEDLGYTVFTPVVDAIGTNEERAAQLSDQLDEVLRATGARKVHLIAHSQGGLDARVLISGLGYADRVASLTTVATPHRGIPAVLFDFFSEQDFSPEFMESFNATYVDAPEVAYYSWSFRSCRLLQFGCIGDSDGEIVDGFLIATHTLLSRWGENDGIVPTESMAWGEWLGLRFADHFDQVGQIADLGIGDDPFDHLAFYVGEARRLRAGGG